jgi:hypothetical protein
MLSPDGRWIAYVSNVAGLIKRVLGTLHAPQRGPPPDDSPDSGLGTAERRTMSFNWRTFRVRVLQSDLKSRRRATVGGKGHR